MKTLSILSAFFGVIAVAILISGCTNTSGTRSGTADIRSYPVTDYNLGDRALKSGPQAICPIKGFAINKEYYTDYQGKRIYFCCSDCDKKFPENPDKYMKLMKDAGVVLEDAPSKGM